MEAVVGLAGSFSFVLGWATGVPDNPAEVDGDWSQHCGILQYSSHGSPTPSVTLLVAHFSQQLSAIAVPYPGKSEQVVGPVGPAESQQSQ